MATIPKTPPSPAAVVTASSPVLAPGDVARALDLLTNYLFADMRTHPDDVTEMKLLANRIRMSSNL